MKLIPVNFKKNHVLSFFTMIGMMIITLNCSSNDLEELKLKNEQLSVELELLKDRYQWIVQNSKTYQKPGKLFTQAKLNTHYEALDEQLLSMNHEKRTIQER